MKIMFEIDGSHIGGDELQRLVEWNGPFLPRAGESIFIDEIIDTLPEKIKGNMWHIWSVDWRFHKEKGIYPTLWLEHQEAQA